MNERRDVKRESVLFESGDSIEQTKEICIWEWSINAQHDEWLLVRKDRTK